MTQFFLSPLLDSSLRIEPKKDMKLLSWALKNGPNQHGKECPGRVKFGSPPASDVTTSFCRFTPLQTQANEQPEN
ncbi:hypothetical protein VTN96DRAFT_7664 [Rasamsonia emersonii]